MIRYRHISHWLAGGVAGWFALSNPLVMLGIIVLFVAYQAIQEYNKKGDSQWDILEFIAGFSILLVTNIIWRLI